MIRRVLIANRGEIAVRIVRACRVLGLETVAVYSDADAAALHVRLADYAERIGPPPAADSYLQVAAIIDAARRAGADAVHPGYGFLSESPTLAAACEEAGLTFVGPPAEVIARLGSKIAARALMATAGVPVVPGATPDDQSENGIRRAAMAIGLPVLLKASSGGGGKGMRQVRDEDELDAAIGAARREAEAAFGDGTLYVERLVERARHVEIQVMADGHGQVVQLFERDCSAQRRHQKILEESPAPGVSEALRARLGEAAVAAAIAARYQNAGTIEFLLDESNATPRFYFLEMNTRIQVEHPVTEEVTGVDLVAAQLRVAGGERLSWTQQRLSIRGHAIEGRVYAEDPARSFLPQAGRLLHYREPHAPGIRIDSGVTEGDDISVHYDPLIAKVVARGDTREAARRTLLNALRGFAILGVRNNVGFLVDLLEHPALVDGTMDTMFIERHLDELTKLDESAPLLAAAVAVDAASRPRTRTTVADAWDRVRGWTG